MADVRPFATHDITFAATCALLETLLASDARTAIVDEAMRGVTMGASLLRLREGMRTHVWKAGAQSIHLSRIIKEHDNRTRDDGFHVLNDWDGIADRVNDDIIPVDVLHYIARMRGHAPVERPTLAILLDYYFMHVLALLTLRAWDEQTPDASFDRVQQLLDQLQGPQGSGQLFADDAETLLLIGTSHFELHERGYGLLLRKTRTLNAAHRLRIALGHACSMGCHLRFGFEATYAKSPAAMRDDNAADYPWLLFAVATLMDEYAQVRAGATSLATEGALVEGLLNGLSPDVEAFVGALPTSLGGADAERVRFREQFDAHKATLVAAFEAYRPSESAYSPLSFFFNFSHNVLKGAVVDALMWGEPWRLTLNDLLTSFARGDRPSASREALAKTLMQYARENPQRIRGKLTPVIVYDPLVGRRAHAEAMRRLRE